jgi:hypothetical protein
MVDLFRRVALGAGITVVALVPVSPSAEALLIPPASAGPPNSQGSTASPIWHRHLHLMPPIGQFTPLWGMLQPLATFGATGLGASLSAPGGFSILNNGNNVPSNLGLMSGAGNGNGNGNIGSNNGNGNQTNGNGNFGVGDGVGNGFAPLSDY